MSKRCHIVAIAMPHIYIYQCNEWNNSKHVREKESFLATKTEAILNHLQSSTLLCKICMKIVPGNVETTSFTIWGKNTSSTTRLQWSRYWYATQRLEKKKKKTQPSIASWTPYDRMGKQWMQITDTVKCWKSRTLQSWLNSFPGIKYFSVLLCDHIDQGPEEFIVQLKQLGYFCSNIWLMLCRPCWIRMLLLPVLISIVSHFELGSVSSMTITRRKRMENALHLLTAALMLQT